MYILMFFIAFLSEITARNTSAAKMLMWGKQKNKLEVSFIMSLRIRNEKEIKHYIQTRFVLDWTLRPKFDFENKESR